MKSKTLLFIYMIILVSLCFIFSFKSVTPHITTIYLVSDSSLADYAQIYEEGKDYVTTTLAVDKDMGIYSIDLNQL